MWIFADAHRWWEVLRKRNKLFLTESDGHLNTTAPQQLNNQRLSLAAIPFQLYTHAHTNTVGGSDKFKTMTSSSHWIRILMEKKRLDLRHAAPKSQYCLRNIWYYRLLCLSDWLTLWFLRQTANWHQYGFSVVSHGESVYCGRERQRLSTGWEQAFIVHLVLTCTVASMKPSGPLPGRHKS